MAIPKSVIKIKKGNVEYVSDCDRVIYTMDELSRAALRDVGKFIANKFKKEYYSIFKKRTGNTGKFTQYWVRKKSKDLQVGIKPNAFYGGFQELGTSKTKKYGILHRVVKENVAEIVEIESKYLSALENEAKALSLISEKEYIDENSE